MRIDYRTNAPTNTYCYKVGTLFDTLDNDVVVIIQTTHNQVELLNLTTFAPYSEKSYTVESFSNLSILEMQKVFNMEELIVRESTLRLEPRVRIGTGSILEKGTGRILVDCISECELQLIHLHSGNRQNNRQVKVGDVDYLTKGELANLINHQLSDYSLVLEDGSLIPVTS